MARDLSLAVRKAIIAVLEDDAAVTAIVPVARLHAVAAPADPVWPFIRYGFATPLPFHATGIDGTRIAGALHGFAKGPQEDAVSALGAAMAAAIDGENGRGLTLPIEGEPAAVAHVAWTGSRILRDGDEAGAYQVVVSFEAVVVG